MDTDPRSIADAHSIAVGERIYKVHNRRRGSGGGEASVLLCYVFSPVQTVLCKPR